jgi:hypothetical protein
LVFFTKINVNMDPAQPPDALFGQFNHMGLSHEKYRRGKLARRE